MRLNFAAVSNHSVPIAPQRQQAHIVQALDSYYSRLVSAEGTLDRVRRALSQLNASLLQAAVEGRLVLTEAELSPTEHREYEPASDFLERILSERRRRWEKSNGSGEYHEPAGPEETTLPKLPAGWCWTTMAQLGEISGGLTQHHRREALQLQMPFLRVANVYADELRLDDVAMIGVTPEEVRRTLLEPGDLLVVEGNGSASQIGRVASWNGAIKRCLHQNHLIKTRFAFPQLSAWVKMFLLSPRGRSLIQAVSSSTSGLHTLSISKVAHLPIPLAPEQEILRALGALGTAQDCVAPAIAAAHRAELMCRGLRSSILALAFSGRLVDQDSSGAPGSAVHDRMLAARATAEAAKPSNTSSNPKRT
jgi:type I restriction enzyme S subunit